MQNEHTKCRQFIIYFQDISPRIKMTYSYRCLSTTIDIHTKYEFFIWKIYYVVYIIKIVSKLSIFASIYAHLEENLIFLFFLDFSNNDHVKAENCRGHIVKWRRVVYRWLRICRNQCCVTLRVFSSIKTNSLVVKPRRLDWGGQLNAYLFL
jgi:hypothetical protein